MHHMVSKVSRKCSNLVNVHLSLSLKFWSGRVLSSFFFVVGVSLVGHLLVFLEVSCGL